MPHSASAETLAPGFVDDTTFSGLSKPTAVRFAPGGDPRVFVAEKDGAIKEFDSLSATAPTVVADLRPEVNSYWDRGLLGLAVDPGFPAKPYLYLLYTLDAPIGGTAPVWNDGCPNPPGPVTDGCVVSGRLTRIQVDPRTNRMVPGSEQVLINDWCQQYPSHSVGDLRFGADGALYASAGEGANATLADYGQGGGTVGSPPPTPANPCGDPPAGVGGSEKPPTAEGGALRSQSVRIADGPASLDGALLRVDPSTGAGLTDNPMASSPDANARRIVAYGLRNPFRFAIRPGTNELWIGNVGAATWEDLDRVVSPTASAPNFGWPCYEGPAPQPGFQALNLNLCTTLYQAGSRSDPYYSYNHNDSVVAGESCPTGNSSITGTAFNAGGSYPSSYDGGLFFADHSRNCIWAMLSGSNGLPDPHNIVTLAAGAANPVALEPGPGNDLYYVDHEGGTIRRLRYHAPHAAAGATPTSGSVPLTVAFSADGSTDSDPSALLSYHWDFGDGGAADTSNPGHTYRIPGTHVARLTVRDQHGLTDSASVSVGVNASPPTASIDSPAASKTWAVGDPISFSGSATDPQDGALPASAFTWSLILHHCFTPSSCHTHSVQDFTGVDSGSFAAPDHSYPSYLELALTVTDSAGLRATQSVRLDPRTVNLTLQSNPPGLQVGLDLESAAAPLTRTEIVGSSHSIAAPSPQDVASTPFSFSSWSDGAPESHDVTVPAADTTLTASYSPPAPPPPAPPSPPSPAQTAALPTIATITSLSVDPRRFRDNSVSPRKRGPHRPPPLGTTIHYSLSWSSEVKLTFERLVRKGQGERYVPVAARAAATPGAGATTCPATRRPPGRAPRPCSAGASASIDLEGHAGANAFRFSGWLGRLRLPPGRYRASLSVVAAFGSPSTIRRATFDVA